ncbi:MAG: hypothetical protein NZT92_09470 [Abditibacteriales bacterium]|nr:hypothetical protein [Abditibacteriales bacterium]MDW8366228.1 hypothetical protein [Abditibacteriales bacterium]
MASTAAKVFISSKEMNPRDCGSDVPGGSGVEGGRNQNLKVVSIVPSKRIEEGPAPPEGTMALRKNEPVPVPNGFHTGIFPFASGGQRPLKLPDPPPVPAA